MDQALPTQFDNTASTWQNMPMIAAMQTGQQNQIAQDNNAALQRAYASEQAYKAQTRPVELSNLVSTGDRIRSGIRHDDAMTRESGTRSTLAEGTMDGNIKGTNAKNDALTLESKVKKGEAEAELYGQLAGSLKNLPAGTPDFVKAQMVQRTLGLSDDPRITQGLLSKSGDLADMLQAHADHVYKNTDAARKEAAKEAAAAARQAGINKTQMGIEQMKIDAGKYEKKAAGVSLTFEQNLLKLKKAHEKFAALTDAAKDAQKDNPALAASYLARREELRAQAQAELAAAGASTVVQPQGQRPSLANKGTQVELGGNKPKLGTAENPIKLD